MATLRELCKSIENYSYDSLKDLKFARKEWRLSSEDEKSQYMKIDRLDESSYSHIPIFVYFLNNKKIPLHFAHYLENDWYIIEENENNVDLDIIENFLNLKQKLPSVLEDIDDFQYYLERKK